MGLDLGRRDRVGELVVNCRNLDANNMMHAFPQEIRSAGTNPFTQARGSTARAGCPAHIHGSRIAAECSAQAEREAGRAGETWVLAQRVVAARPHRPLFFPCRER